MNKFVIYYYLCCLKVCFLFRKKRDTNILLIINLLKTNYENFYKFVEVWFFATSLLCSRSRLY